MSKEKAWINEELLQLIDLRSSYKNRHVDKVREVKYREKFDLGFRKTGLICSKIVKP